MTVEEMRAQFDAEWILIEDPQTNESLEVLGVKVLHHGKDRDEIYRQAVARRPSVPQFFIPVKYRKTRRSCCEIMRVLFYIVVLLASFIIAAYPWIKGISKIQCNAKLYASLTGLAGILWSCLGGLILLIPQENRSFVTPETLHGLKTFLGGLACGMAVLFVLIQAERKGLGS